MAPRHQARRSARRSLGRRRRRGVQDAEGCRRQRRRRHVRRAHRVPRHRDQGAAAQSGLRRSEAHRRGGAPAQWRRRDRAICRAPARRGRRVDQSERAQPGQRQQPPAVTTLELRGSPMQIEPPADAFSARYGRGEAQVVWTTLVADLETPVSAFLKIAGPRPMSFLLESVEGGAGGGRYSVIGLDPDVVWRSVNGRAEINRTARTITDHFVASQAPPLQALRALIAESRIDLPEGLPPMAAGVFGYLGYDMVRLMEELPASHPDPIGIPDAVLIRPTRSEERRVGKEGRSRGAPD